MASIWRRLSGFRGFSRQLAIWNGKFSGEKPMLDASGRPIEASGLGSARAHRGDSIVVRASRREPASLGHGSRSHRHPSHRAGLSPEAHAGGIRARRAVRAARRMAGDECRAFRIFPPVSRHIVGRPGRTLAFQLCTGRRKRAPRADSCACCIKPSQRRRYWAKKRYSRNSTRCMRATWRHRLALESVPRRTRHFVSRAVKPRGL